MREIPDTDAGSPATSLRACVAAILELEPADIPLPPEDAVAFVHRWLGGLGLGLAAVAAPESFAWPGPWIGRVRAAEPAHQRYVVMFGVPSGVIWDPSGRPEPGREQIEAGYLIAAADIALARPSITDAPASPGTVEAIWRAASAGEPPEQLERVRAIPGLGLEGDRYTQSAGSFPTGVPGSALTLIEAEVCESFDPPLAGNDHRRNLVTRGIDLNALVGAEFTIGSTRLRGMRLCEPCTVMQRYAARPLLRALVHRGGLRADILAEGEIAVGDELRVVAD